MKKFNLIIVSFLTVFVACKKEVPIISGEGYEDWTTATHASATPNYATVFNESKVHRLDIVITEDYWQVMQDDVANLLAPSAGGGFPSENPIYVPCQIYYEGKQWYDVGIRYKGNSSLKSAYKQGNNKLPFRLEFNHFEDENPLIFGQSFYGFHQLSFSSGFNDKSLIREKITPDLFREFGVPAARTAFYRLYVDYGEGPIYYGLYTLVEVIFDTMINEQFSGSDGNCYKPDKNGAHLNSLTAINEVSMPNKTHPGVYDEVTNLVTALISPDRISNRTQWRENLEKTIDMPQYLKYLAANTTISNWDTYGRMAHNYYLYANPADGKLNWIPWDNNHSLAKNGAQPALNFNFSNMQNNTPVNGIHTWPLIFYIYNDPVYQVQYQQYIDEFILNVFTVSNVQNKVNTAANLIEQYAVGSDGEQPGYSFIKSSTEWTNSIIQLNNYAQIRWTEADNYTP